MANAHGSLVIKKKGSSELFFGALLILLPLVLLRYRPVPGAGFSLGDYFVRAVLAAVFVAGIALAFGGIRRRVLCQKLLRLKMLFERRSRVPLKMAAELLGCSLSALVNDVRDMQKYGLTQGLYADLLRKQLVREEVKSGKDWLSKSVQVVKDFVGINTPPAPEPEPEIEDTDGITLREEHAKSAKPFYAFAAVWAAYALFFPFYRTLDLAIALILALIAYFHTSWNAPARTVIIEVLPIVAGPVQTGNQTLDQMLQSVHLQMETLRTLERNACGKLHEPVRDILRTTEQIIEQVKQHPNKAGEMRQFFNYTLPTTINLLQNYQELRAQPVQGENITAAMGKIEGMTATMVDAFHRQLDALFADKALDIEVEIDVMGQMLGGSDDIRNSVSNQ